MTFEWGRAVERRIASVPFLMYSPRRTQVVQLLEDGARWSDRTHLVQGDRRLMFSDMFGEIERVAAKLHEGGLHAGDRLLLLAPNSIEWVVAMWAGFRLGAIVALGNSWWGGADVEHAVSLLHPTVVLADRPRLALVPSGPKSVDIASLAPAEADAGPRRPTCHRAPPGTRTTRRSSSSRPVRRASRRPSFSRTDRSWPICTICSPSPGVFPTRSTRLAPTPSACRVARCSTWAVSSP